MLKLLNTGYAHDVKVECVYALMGLHAAKAISSMGKPAKRSRAKLVLHANIVRRIMQVGIYAACCGDDCESVGIICSNMLPYLR